MFRMITGAFVSLLSLLFFCTTASAAPPLVGIGLSVSFAHVIAPVAFKCGMVNGKLVCGSTKGNESRGDDDDDVDDKPKKSKDKVIPKTCGKKVNCEAGFVKLEKPNKYGACCEAREGLPPEKCKFPGEVGTPPNCECPKNTEFKGFRGCVKFTYQKASCISRPSQRAAENLAKQCKAEGGYGSCPTLEECCCMKKVFAN